MRWRRVVCLMMAWGLVATLGAAPAAAADVDAAAWSSWMSITPVANDPLGDTIPQSRWFSDIQGDWVVYCDDTNDAAVDWNVRAYNLKTREDKSVCAATGVQTWPRVYGDWVVWWDARDPANTDIYAYNLATNTEKRLTSRAGEQGYPDISGTKVVYQDTGAGGDIYLYDLATGTDSVLALGAGAQITPAISGDRAVYNQSGDIYAFDLRTAAISRLTNDAIADLMPDIDGTLVAWQHLGGTWDIWTQNLAGGAAAQMPGEFFAADDLWPRVNGDHVVFMRGAAPSRDICVYDTRVGAWATLTTDTGDDVTPAIDGANVAYTAGWVAGPPAGGDIMLGHLIAPVITAAPAVSPIAYNTAATINGTLTENGLALGGIAVTLDWSPDGGHSWAASATATTNSSGGFTFATAPLTSNQLYRVRYDGLIGHILFFNLIDRFSALSSPITVQVQPPVTLVPATAGKPTGYPSTGRKTRYYTVYGSLKPRQTAAASPLGSVTVKCYRRNSSGKYVWKKSFATSVFDYYTGSRYRARVKLPTAGRWRMRAHFKGSAINKPAYSSYTYVRVK